MKVMNFKKGDKVKIIGGRWKGAPGVVKRGTKTGNWVMVKAPMIDYLLPVDPENLEHGK
jgi:ribosomal protein L24